MNRHSLALDSMRARLMAWVAAVIVVCMAVTFLVVYDATGSRLRSEIERGPSFGQRTNENHLERRCSLLNRP